MSRLFRGSSSLASFSDELAQLVEQSLPRTAGIWVKTTDLTGSGNGSGWVYDRRHIVTNHHVISNSSNVVRVLLPDQSEKIARIVGSDPATDLAVLQIEEAGVDPFTIRSSGPVRQGELCMALGTPKGISDSVSFGIVSGLGRQVLMDDYKFEESIQVDATINPGNSGGPLVDMRGELIGVNFCGRNDAALINFAIPAEVVVDVVPELIAHGTIKRATIGVAISAKVAEIEGLMTPIVEVTRTIGHSPLQEGDLLLKIDGSDIRRRYDLMRRLNRDSIGREVTLSVLRDAEMISVEVIPKERQA